MLARMYEHRLKGCGAIGYLSLPQRQEVQEVLRRRHSKSGGMKKVSLITDGSCLGNPGPGGWACVLRFGGVKKEFFGFDPRTTNNRMELMASIQGLLALKEPCEVEITTDSEYVLLWDHEVDYQVEAEALVAEA